MHRMLRFMSLPRRLFWQHAARQALVAAILAAMVLVYKTYLTPQTLPALIVAGATGCVAAWALSVMLILSRRDREMFGKVARAMTHR
jgi:hypothetical protein